MTSNVQGAVELAAMSDERGHIAGGGFRAAVPPFPEEMELRDGWLAWRGRSTANAPANVDLRDMLDTFIRIKNDRGVLSFARRFSVLLLCEKHGLPSSHEGPDRDLERPLGCFPQLAVDDYFRLERLEDWHRLVAEARAIVNIGASLHRGTVPAPDQWKELGPVQWARPWTGGSLTSAKERLSTQVHHWLDMAGAAFAFVWSEGEPQLQVGGHTFQVLSLQLAQAVARSTFTICDSCYEPYQRRGRRAPRGRRNYCPDCRGTRAARVRKRASREVQS